MPAFSKARSLPRNVWVVTVTSFLTDISSEMIFNLLPLFLANVLGVRTSLIGLIEGMAESASSFLKIASGWLSDRMARRKRLTVLGYGISTVAKPFLYWAGSWGAVLGVRLADRFGKGVRTAPRDALLAESVVAHRRGLAFGLHRAGDTGGAMCGLLIALLVVWSTQRASLELEQATFQRLVLLSIIPAALAVLVLAIGAQEVRAERRPARAKLPSGPFRDLDPPFRRFVAVMVVFTLGNSADAFLILRAQERGATVVEVLAMLATFNFVYALVSGPAGALSDRFGRRRLIIAGWTVYGLLYLGFALAETRWQIWLLYALYGIYYGAFEGTARAYVADLVLPDHRGTAFGVYHAAVGAAAMPASLIAGALWQVFGPPAPFVLGALLAFSALLLLWHWVPEQ